ncbi:MAG: DUF4294 domain-containing protein [Bacteroidia bacterium]|nr:DUF4294 domain-containing protein [Bacteroidia bacterium]
MTIVKTTLHILLILLVSSNLVEAQEKPTMYVPYTVENGDTVRYMSLPAVNIVAELKFKSKKEKEKYNKLKRDIRKVYPLAILAGVKIEEYNAKLATLKTELERDLYMKRAEKELIKEFKDDIEKLTLSQGRLLIKLIDRETGSSSYGLVKELRGSFSAFMWQTVALMFNASLKKEYDATGDDKMVELIIHQIENGDV